MEEDESEIGEAATTEHLATEGAVEVEDESEIDEAATTEHPQGTVEVEEEEQSQIDEARKTDYHAQPLAKLPEKRKRSCLCLATDSQISAVMDHMRLLLNNYVTSTCTRSIPVFR
ncbi:hypothetical protein ACFX11_004079 [Malus domestica]